MIRVQTEDFDLSMENFKLRQDSSPLEISSQRNHIGAIVTFTGIVRDFSKPNVQKDSEDEFFLEHYPGMTEKVLQKIEHDAHQRWDIINSTVIHRVGKLKASDNIVFIGVSSRHRKNAFLACEFIIDLLKTQAPFWKKEGKSWLNADSTDKEKALSWLK